MKYLHIQYSQNDKSIITRIETSIVSSNTVKTARQNDKSIITRIETFVLVHLDWCKTRSKWQIHHNKDWNEDIEVMSKRVKDQSKWQIHHNKDWNPISLSLCLYCFRSKWQIHHNKDWNKAAEKQPEQKHCQNDKSIITRIETLVQTCKV